jgi:hypothetical protein
MRFVFAAGQKQISRNGTLPGVALYQSVRED